MTLDEWKLSEYHKRLISAALPLRKGVSFARVLTRVQTAARNYLREYDAHESRYKNIDLVQRKNGKSALLMEYRHYGSRGRVRRVAMRGYITALVPIYENATGKRVARHIHEVVTQYRYGLPAEAKQKEKPHPFLTACVKAVGKRYPSKIVQEVLEELHELRP